VAAGEGDGGDQGSEADGAFEDGLGLGDL